MPETAVQLRATEPVVPVVVALTSALARLSLSPYSRRSNTIVIAVDGIVERLCILLIHANAISAEILAHRSYSTTPRSKTSPGRYSPDRHPRSCPCLQEH